MEFKIEKVVKNNGEVGYVLFHKPESIFGADFDAAPYPPQYQVLSKGFLSIAEAEGYANSLVGRKVKSTETVKTFII